MSETTRLHRGKNTNTQPRANTHKPLTCGQATQCTCEQRCEHMTRKMSAAGAALWHRLQNGACML